MALLALTWADGSGLVSVELENDDRVVLIFDDEVEARAVGAAIGEQAWPRMLAITELEGDQEAVRAGVDLWSSMRSELERLRAVFPGESLHRHLVGAIRQRAPGEVE